MRNIRCIDCGQLLVAAGTVGTRYECAAPMPAWADDHAAHRILFPDFVLAVRTCDAHEPLPEKKESER
jgi:hypothetical protein